jgi:hypothetical protein
MAAEVPPPSIGGATRPGSPVRRTPRSPPGLPLPEPTTVPRLGCTRTWRTVRPTISGSRSPCRSSRRSRRPARVLSRRAQTPRRALASAGTWLRRHDATTASGCVGNIAKDPVVAVPVVSDPRNAVERHPVPAAPRASAGELMGPRAWAWWPGAWRWPGSRPTPRYRSRTSVPGQACRRGAGTGQARGRRTVRRQG